MKTSISEKARIGVMTVGHKEYWEWNQFPAMKGDLTRMGQEIADCIAETGAEVYFEFVDNREQSVEAGRRFKALDIDLLFLHMTRYYGTVSEKNHDFISRCINYIHDHFLEELTIEQLSTVAFVSPSHLTRIFRQRTGYSPLAYVRAYRLSIAKHELLHSQNSIEKIAQLSGFHDAKYFSRFFKAETGMTPRDYRKKVLAENKEKREYK